MNRTVTAAVIALSAASASAAPTALVTVGTTLHRVDLSNGSFETFAIGDEIVSQHIDMQGRIIAHSNSEGPNGFEVYELTGAESAAPSLSLITDTRTEQAPTHTSAEGTLYAVRAGDLLTADQSTFELTFVSSIGNLVTAEERLIGGSAYDPDSDRFFIVSVDGFLRELEDFDTPNPFATIIGQFGTDVRNHGLEYFEGTLYVTTQNDAGTLVSIGSIDTSDGTYTSIVDIPSDDRAALSISVIPTPGTTMIAGLAGLAALRRRR